MGFQALLQDAMSSESKGDVAAVPNNTNSSRQSPCRLDTTAGLGRWEPEGCQSPKVVKRQRSAS